MQVRKELFPCFKISPAEALVCFGDGDIGEAGDKVEHYCEEEKHGKVIPHDDEARDDGDERGDDKEGRLHERKLSSAVLRAREFCEIHMIGNPIEKPVDEEDEHREGDEEPGGFFGHEDEDAEMKRACENACAKGIPEPKAV